MTRWAQDVTPDNVLPEYPRPQLVREQWQNLNGLWEYAVSAREASQPALMPNKILVPFCIGSAVLDATGGWQPRGKQKIETIATPKGIRYTPCSGIWQTVWLEAVPAAHVETVRIVPNAIDGTVVVTVQAPGRLTGDSHHSRCVAVVGVLGPHAVTCESIGDMRKYS